MITQLFMQLDHTTNNAVTPNFLLVFTVLKTVSFSNSEILRDSATKVEHTDRRQTWSVSVNISLHSALNSSFKLEAFIFR